MGLLSILRKQREREREIRVLILGLDNAGKTTITKKFLGEDLSLVEPTLGFNIKTVDFQGFTINFLGCWWTEEVYVHIGVIILSKQMRLFGLLILEIKRLVACRNELRSLLGEERLSGASLLVLANKQGPAQRSSCDRYRQDTGVRGNQIAPLAYLQLQCNDR
ncbi:ADP-ribosylation factor-like protein 2 family protein [Ostertagia ostertagi]